MPKQERGMMTMQNFELKPCPFCGTKMDAKDTNALTSDGGAENG